MNRTIIWSETAKNTYLEILQNIMSSWGTNSAKKFAQKVEKVLNSIARNPYIFPASAQSPGANIRKCVISPQTSIFYKVEDDRVFLITFFDNRRNPQKLDID